MIPNMVTKRSLIFRISKYGHETLWLNFKIYTELSHKHSESQDPYKLFIALFTNNLEKDPWTSNRWNSNPTEDRYKLFKPI